MYTNEKFKLWDLKKKPDGQDLDLKNGVSPHLKYLCSFNQN